MAMHQMLIATMTGRAAEDSVNVKQQQLFGSCLAHHVLGLVTATVTDAIMMK